MQLHEHLPQSKCLAFTDLDIIVHVFQPPRPASPTTAAVLELQELE